MVNYQVGVIRFKEEAMPGRTTRQQARQRAIQTFMLSLDKIYPRRRAVPLKGRTFLDWEKRRVGTVISGRALTSGCSLRGGSTWPPRPPRGVRPPWPPPPPGAAIAWPPPPLQCTIGKRRAERDHAVHRPLAAR